MNFILNNIVCPNILEMSPYSCARDEFEGEASIYLDANENPFDNGLNRYPDPHQKDLKEIISQKKAIGSDQLFLGNGSDEAIDLLFRIFCNSGKDNYISITPTYGMYEVCGRINNIERREALLDDAFQLDVEKIKALWDQQTKLIFLCSPNNPTGNMLSKEAILSLCESFHGIVVVDEAYIDFSSEPSFTNYLDQTPNLVVLQTFSKAWGLAGIRLGMAMAQKEVIDLFNKVKYPYNVNQLTQQKALDYLVNKQEKVDQEIKNIIAERELLKRELNELSTVEKVYPSEANFLLIKISNATGIYQALLQKGIVTRNRSKVVLCDECLRITIGTPDENRVLVEQIKAITEK